MITCYIALYVLNLAWALFVRDPAVMGGYIRSSVDDGDLFVMA